MKARIFSTRIEENDPPLHIIPEDVEGKRIVHFFKKIVLFKYLRNSKRRNKGNITLKSNSNKIILCWGEG